MALRTDVLDVEEDAFTLFQDLLDAEVGVPAAFKLNDQFMPHVLTDVGAIGLGGSVKYQRLEPLQFYATSFFIRQ